MQTHYSDYFNFIYAETISQNTKYSNLIVMSGVFENDAFEDRS